MYAEHFGLRELPFTLTPNTRFFLNLTSHQEALNLMLVALHSGDGFIKVVGEVGTGKTLLCRKLLNSLDESQFVTAYIPNSNLNPAEFHCAVANELGIYTPEKSNQDLLQLLTRRLIEHAQHGKRVVVLVDEAQAMPDETIEALRLLTNLETESEKLFQVVLFGQPELDKKLNQYSLRQLTQRITFSYRLKKLEPDEVRAYIHWRMQAAGYVGKPSFERDACDLIARAAGGIPRLVNVLSHKALMSAYGKGDEKVKVLHVVRAIEDTEGVALPCASLIKQWLSAVVAVMAIAMITWGVMIVGMQP
ncbi:AAA family ATPase [Pontibacterium granulatum]|uniref:ExeA family protein n=1 Tax=Pontibacterium granulatum TaxID=2036029 RepID=UPI00249A7427|nr:AAA family ATPase [Pontibacterium granulatum]MDI3325066.1 AAA family ATPase [Pontibacterium granulatum]